MGRKSLAGLLFSLIAAGILVVIGTAFKVKELSRIPNKDMWE